MSGRQSAATERAVASWKPGEDVTKHALAHGINASTLYRALVRAGVLSKRKR